MSTHTRRQRTQLFRTDTTWSVEQEGRFLFISESDGDEVAKQTRRFASEPLATEALRELVAQRRVEGFADVADWPRGAIDEASLRRFLEFSPALSKIESVLVEYVHATWVDYQNHYGRHARLSDLLLRARYDSTQDVNDDLEDNVHALITKCQRWLGEKNDERLLSGLPVTLLCHHRVFSSVSPKDLARHVSFHRLTETQVALLREWTGCEAPAERSSLDFEEEVGCFPECYRAFLSMQREDLNLDRVVVFGTYRSLMRAWVGYRSWFDDNEEVEQRDDCFPVAQPESNSDFYVLGKEGVVYLWRHDERSDYEACAADWTAFMQGLRERSK